MIENLSTKHSQTKNYKLRNSIIIKRLTLRLTQNKIIKQNFVIFFRLSIVLKNQKEKSFTTKRSMFSHILSVLDFMGMGVDAIILKVMLIHIWSHLLLLA